MNAALFRFNDFSIGKKLFCGFMSLIFLITAMSLYSIYSFKVIAHNADKTSLTNKVGDLLDVARRNRIVYMQNGDEKTMEANGDAIQTMQALLKKADNFTWTGNAKTNFDLLSDSIKNYSQLRAIFHEKSIRSNALAAKLKQNDGQQYLTVLQKSLQDDTAELSVREALFTLLQNFSNLHEAGKSLLENPSDATYANYENSFSQAEVLYKTRMMGVSDAEKTLIAPVWGYFQAFRTDAKLYLSAKQDTQNAADSMGVGAEALNKATAGLIQSQAKDNAKAIADTIVLISILTVLAIIAGLLAAWYITRKITQPIMVNLALAERIAAGDLTAVITTYSKDELGRLTQSMGVMNARLCEMITGIRESVGHLATASSQIAAGNIDLAARTEQQSAAVVETASSMEELTSTVRLNADNAVQASQLATSARADACKGGEIVNDVVMTMNGIAASSKKITDIISVINGIAFQTNILALNAAVEAARAGEQGRGFAVVAGEVRILAQRSANAAKEIESLINESVDRIGTGTELVTKAGISMEDIVQSVTHVSQIIDEISTSSNEQRQGIEQIGKAVTEMDSTTQQNATLVQESSAAAISLEEQAKRLDEMVSVFRVPGVSSRKNATELRLSTPVTSGGGIERHPKNTSSKQDWTTF